MEFGVLGNLRVVRDGVCLNPGPSQRRAVLAALLANPNRNITGEHLVQAVWGDDPPRTAGKNLQVHIYHLRRLFAEPDRITFEFTGYTLRVAPDELDAHRFERLLAAGRSALAGGAPTESERLLTEALGLWRGPAFADLEAAGTVAREALRLEELRMVAHETRNEARLVAGRHRELIPEVVGALDQHPYRERLAGQLMTALARDGRQREALAVYHRVREGLAEELGVDPGEELRARYTEVLRGGGTAAVNARDLDVVEAHQLPAGPAGEADPPADRPAAASAGTGVTRESLRWLITATAVVDRTVAVTRPERLAVADPHGAVPSELYRPAEARRWLDRERGTLTAALRSAFEQGWHDPAWRLAHGMFSLYFLRAEWDGLRRAYEAAVRSAIAAGVPAAVGPLRVGLAIGYAGTGRPALAVAELQRARSAAATHGNRRCELAAVCELASLAIAAGDVDQATELLEQGRRLSRAELAAAAEAAGWLLRLRGEIALARGEPARAGGDLESALAKALAAGDGHGTAVTLSALARARLALGDPGGGVTYARQAIAVATAWRDVPAGRRAREWLEQCASAYRRETG